MVLTFIMSCNSDFIELNPISTVTVDALYITDKDFEDAVIGMYSPLRIQYENFWLFGDLPGDDTEQQHSASIDLVSMNNFFVNSSMAVLNSTWLNYYKVIFNANSLLSKIEGADPAIVKEFGSEFADLFEASGTMQVEYEPVGLPSEIRIIAPEMPKIMIDTSNMIDRIKIDSSEVKIPDIKIYGPDTPIPTSIRLDGSELPEEFDLVYRGGPIPVKVETELTLKVESTLPERIILEIPRPIPERIILESNLPDKIILEGPKSIPIELPEGFGIPLLFPEKMPEMEVVYRGAPIEVKITMDQIMDKNADGQNCVMITPCIR